MDHERWQRMPGRFTLREITINVDIPGFRSKSITVATSLIDPKQFPTHEFGKLYRMRWMAELFLRDIKISQGMDILRCKSPEMIHKELLMHLIAYNLVREAIRSAACRHRTPIHGLSFKTALTAVRNWKCVYEQEDIAPPKFPESLLSYLYRATLPHRPNRIEPRAIKRRPKEYDLLNKPREIMRQRSIECAAQSA